MYNRNFAMKNNNDGQTAHMTDYCS